MKHHAILNYGKNARLMDSICKRRFQGAGRAPVASIEDFKKLPEEHQCSHCRKIIERRGL